MQTAIDDNDGASRKALEDQYGTGNVWTTKELQEEFQVHSFLAPYATVERRSDRQRGTVQFNHNPRYYFNFVPTNVGG